MKPGILTLTETSPAQGFVEPITLQQAKKFLNLPEYSPVDGEADGLIESLISAAREVAEGYQGRDFVGKQYDLTLDTFPSGEIQLRDNLESVDVVRYSSSGGADVDLVENTDYIVDTRRALIMPPVNGAWPAADLWPSSAVLVRFTVSAQEPPEHVLNGMKQLISSWFCGRLPFELGASNVQEYPFTVTMLLTMGAKRAFK
jgi:uncharacterized phiE125 gp8 family phage protein